VVRWNWTDEVWAPVGLKGFGLAFEMCPLGLVRGIVGGTAATKRLWLLPQDDGDGPYYRLRVVGFVSEIRVREIFRRFGVAETLDDQWLARTRERVLAENILAHGWIAMDEAVRDAVREARDCDLEMLGMTMERGCPWAWARVGGDARGADPVLGF